MVKIAVLGYGTVGSGIVEVIKTNQKLINERAGEATSSLEKLRMLGFKRSFNLLPLKLPCDTLRSMGQG